MRTFRVFSVLMVLIVSIPPCFGSAYALTWDMGLKGGVNQSKLRGDPVSLWLGEGETRLNGVVSDYKTGFIGGAYVSVQFSEFFSIQTELLYTQQGGKGPVSGYALIHPPYDNPRLAWFEGTLSLHLDYIEVPVVAQISFDADDGERLSLRAYAGPTFGFSTSAEMELSGRANLRLQDGNTRWVQVDERTGVGRRIKDFQFGALIGFSVSYALEKVDLFIDARWGRGFTTIDNSGNDLRTYNSSIAFMAGFGVPLWN